MNWNEKTATGREFLIIQNRKACALHAMGPDIYPDTPQKFARYMSENIVYRSETPFMCLTGPEAVMDFLVREKNLYNRIGHGVETYLAEGEKCEILRLIRERGAEEGALVDLTLDEAGLVAGIRRFSEKREKTRRGPGGGISLYPARTVPDADGKKRYIDREEDEIFIPSVYKSEMELLFELVGDEYTDMEERRYMNMRDWVAMVDLWGRINEAEDPEALKEELFRPLRSLFEDNRHYRITMDVMFWDVWDGRDEYTRRMQRMLKEYVYAYSDRWNLMSKF